MEAGRDLHPWEGAEGEKCCNLGSALTSGDIGWDIKGASECNNQFVAGRAKRHLHGRSMPPSWVLQAETCVCWCRQGLGARTQDLEDRQTRGED